MSIGIDGSKMKTFGPKSRGGVALVAPTSVTVVSPRVEVSPGTSPTSLSFPVVPSYAASGWPGSPPPPADAGGELSLDDAQAPSATVATIAKPARAQETNRGVVRSRWQSVKV